MKVEIVELAKKIVVGVSAETGNSDPEMGAVISGLWQKLYQGGVSGVIPNKINSHAIGLYSDYTKDGYTVTVGHEVSAPGHEEWAVKTIPAGTYAKFSFYGHMQKAVADAWGEIWKMDLDRSFTGDYEEYLDHDGENAHIHIFIALK